MREGLKLFDKLAAYLFIVWTLIIWKYLKKLFTDTNSDDGKSSYTIINVSIVGTLIKGHDTLL